MSEDSEDPHAADYPEPPVAPGEAPDPTNPPPEPAEPPAPSDTGIYTPEIEAAARERRNMEHVLPMPSAVSVKVSGFPKKGPPEPEPSDEGKEVAELAEDTLRAFEKRFYGKIAFNHPLPSMLASDEGAALRQDVILKLLEAAYKERVRHAYAADIERQRHALELAKHEVFRTDMLADEERRRKQPKDPLFDGKTIGKELGDMMAELAPAMQDLVKGRKRVRVDTPKGADDEQQQVRLQEFLERLNSGQRQQAPYEPPVSGDAPSGESGAGSSLAYTLKAAGQCGYVFPDGTHCANAQDAHPVVSAVPGWSHSWGQTPPDWGGVSTASESTKPATAPPEPPADTHPDDSS
jgi:hypothetical protein